MPPSPCVSQCDLRGLRGCHLHRVFRNVIYEVYGVPPSPCVSQCDLQGLRGCHLHRVFRNVIYEVYGGATFTVCFAM